MNDYASLVVPSGNAHEPFHGWFHFKEGFSHQLIDRIIKDSGLPLRDGVSFLDPFAGSGTSLISVLESVRRSGLTAEITGIERNPVMHLISSAKLNGAVRGRELAGLVRRELSHFEGRLLAMRERKSLRTASVTLNNPRFFDPDVVRSLIALGRAADATTDQDVREVFRCCVAMSVERSGRIRKDGRALRHHPRKPVATPQRAFGDALTKVLRDLDGAEPVSEVKARVVLGDARALTKDVKNPVDWAIFSPPYPNNIDYTEVYKAEAWALGFFAEVSDMRAQRLMTLRSHPSVKFEDEYKSLNCLNPSAMEELVAPILAVVPSDRYKTGRIRLVKGYFDDMSKVLLDLSRSMSASGRACIIVGNSSHGRVGEDFVIAADLLLARLAEIVGWSVEEIRVCRYPRRRSNEQGWLRESAVLLQWDGASPKAGGTS